MHIHVYFVGGGGGGGGPYIRLPPQRRVRHNLCNVLSRDYAAKLIQTVMIFPSFGTKCVILPVSGMIAIANLAQISFTVGARMMSPCLWG